MPGISFQPIINLKPPHRWILYITMQRYCTAGYSHFFISRRDLDRKYPLIGEFRCDIISTGDGLLANGIQLTTTIEDTIELERTETVTNILSIEVRELKSWLNDHMDSL